MLVRPEPVREPLGQPALDSLGGHDDQLAGEHPTDRLSQELTELVGEQVRARVDVHGQAHGSTVCARSDDQGAVVIGHEEDGVASFNRRNALGT